MEVKGASLDHEELFHLALQASSTGDHDKAIRYLKEGITLSPTAKFYYILGAQHAEIGMFDRAVEEMTKALELDGSMHTARFQLGLLQLTMNDVDGATLTWSGLDQLQDQDSLKLFKMGILTAVTGDFAKALELANKGIENNLENPALNKDMSNLIERWQGFLEDSDKELIATEAESSSKEAIDESKNSNHFFLSAYKDDQTD
ncbi:hypothetical protein A9Q99_08110 [Gammaproteobacteria bacterium 45_16_T64]|nr:hypothetical protein A9Q99_08110 [Gammaproteobacteria bacterium 45_16_T64]